MLFPHVLVTQTKPEISRAEKVSRYWEYFPVPQVKQLRHLLKIPAFPQIRLTVFLNVSVYLQCGIEKVRMVACKTRLRVQVVKVVNNITWNECACFEHSTKVTGPDTVVFVEERDPDATHDDDAEQYNSLNYRPASTAPSEARSRYSVADVPIEVRCFRSRFQACLQRQLPPSVLLPSRLPSTLARPEPLECVNLDAV